jgi:hypothetical protein
VVVDKRRVDRSRVRLAEVEIGDETGTVSLRARDEQIDVLEDVSKRDGAVVLRNCTLELYQGKHIRLAVTKWGKLCTYPDTVASTPPPPSKMNFDRNFSLIDLSVVASEMVDPNPEQSYNPRSTKPNEASEGDLHIARVININKHNLLRVGEVGEAIDDKRAPNKVESAALHKLIIVEGRHQQQKEDRCNRFLVKCGTKVCMGTLRDMIKLWTLGSTRIHIADSKMFRHSR